jgi:hypothetical protein
MGTLPNCDDAPPADLDTTTWSTADRYAYEAAWLNGYLDETTKLCRQVIEHNNNQ